MILLPPGLRVPQRKPLEVKQTGWPDLPFCDAYCLRGLGQLLNHMGLGFLTCKMGIAVIRDCYGRETEDRYWELNCIHQVLGYMTQVHPALG